MTFLRKYPVITKIVVNDTILEQVKSIRYLGCDVAYGQLSIGTQNKKRYKLNSIIAVANLPVCTRNMGYNKIKTVKYKLRK